MSVCTACFESDIVPVCTIEFVFGTIQTDSETVTVYLKNVATGRINQFVGDVDESGYVTLTSVALNNGIGYELWATEDGENINNRLTITHAAVDYDCISFTAKRISDNVEFLTYDLMITE